MEIKWIGHSCFLIKNLLGKKVLIDPMQIYPYIQKYDLKVTQYKTKGIKVIGEEVKIRY